MTRATSRFQGCGASTRRWVIRGGLIAGAFSLGACETAQEASPEPSPTATSTPTPTPAPWPLTLEEGDFQLLAPFAIQVRLSEEDEPKVLQPAGELNAQGEVFTGTLTWTLYESVTDFQAGQVACTYVQTLDGLSDPTLYPSIACEGCQAYFQVQAEPPPSHSCPGDVLVALLDTSRDGQLSDQELHPVDQWGFSPFDTQTAPTSWEAYSGWCSLGTYLYCWGGQYVAWSRAWATAESAYTPLFALHPPIPDPAPSSCPYGDGAAPEGCSTP